MAKKKSNTAWIVLLIYEDYGIDMSLFESKAEANKVLDSAYCCLDPEEREKVRYLCTELEIHRKGEI